VTAVPRHVLSLFTLAAALVALTSCGSGAGAPKSSLGSAGHIVAVADPEAAQSFASARRPVNGVKPPTPGTLKAAKSLPAAATDDESGVSPGAPSDAEIKRELKAMQKVQADQRRQLKEAAGAGASLNVDGTASPPPGASLAIARIIAGGNAIADYPYVYGGGHGSFVDSAYDCSGSVSYALAAAGLLDAPLTSGELAHWGAPGQGKHVTIFANAGHTFMYVDGLRFDTSGRSGPRGSRWQTAHRSLAGFVMRHPPGL
jgi:cell wall-associated NlpC family hydrolase